MRIQTNDRSRKTVGLIAGLACAWLTGVAHAAVIVTTNPSDITGFESGATVESFDNVSGITPVTITDYTPKDVTGSAALMTKDPAQPAFFNSGGATFNNPTSNPGVPIAVVTPSGGIAADKLSGNNVAGPLGVVTPPSTLFDAGAFMEVIFPTGVSRVGLYVAHGTVTLILKDSNNSNLAGDFTGTAPAGSFLEISRSAADVFGATLLGAGAFTIDDFTYGTSGSSSGGNGGTGGGSNNVPDAGNSLNLALAATFLGLAGRKFRRTSALQS
jgi:hypothetical protein